MDPHGPDYGVETYRCRACEAKAAMESRWRKDQNADLGGVYFAATDRGVTDG